MYAISCIRLVFAIPSGWLRWTQHEPTDLWEIEKYQWQSHARHPRVNGQFYFTRSSWTSGECCPSRYWCKCHLTLSLITCSFSFSFPQITEFLESTVKYQLPLKADLLRSFPFKEISSFNSSVSSDNRSTVKWSFSKSKASLDSSFSTFYSSLEGPITHAISSLSLSSLSPKEPVAANNCLDSSNSSTCWTNNMRAKGLHREQEKEDKKKSVYSTGTVSAGALLASLGIHEKDLQLLRSTPTLQSPSPGKYKATKGCNNFYCESVLWVKCHWRRGRKSSLKVKIDAREERKRKKANDSRTCCWCWKM